MGRLVQQLSRLTIVAGLTLAGVHCDRGEGTTASAEVQAAASDPSFATDLRTVAAARIFFSHHSVGGNIIEGLKALSATEGVSLRIASVDEAAASTGPVFAEDTGGENRFPKSKIDAFTANLKRAKGLDPDVAFIKFCYVD